LEYQETGGQGISMKVIEQIEKASTKKAMVMVNLVMRVLGTRKLNQVVEDVFMGTFTAYSV
jgi:hypothetical protein